MGDRLAHALEAPVGVRDGPLLLGVRLLREDDGRVLADALGEERRVCDDRGRAAQGPLPRAAVGQRAQRVDVQQVERGELAAGERLGDLRRRAAGCLRLGAAVAGLLRDGGRVTGVRLENGEEIPADAVVLATDAQVAARLGGLETPGGALHATAIYLAGARPVYAGRKIVLNAAPSALVNNVQQLTNVVPEYAPPGRHLLSAVVLGLPDMTDRELVIAVMRDLRRVFAGDTAALQALDTYYPLRVYRIRYAQFPQPPGIYAALPQNRTEQPGLYAAAEWTEGSSINGAMTSGERCAAVIAEDRGANGRS